MQCMYLNNPQPLLFHNQQRQRARDTVTFDCCFKHIMICNYDSYQEDSMQICIYIYMKILIYLHSTKACMTSLPVSAPSGRGGADVEGGARGC